MSYPTKIEDGMTNMQVLGPAMEIETQADADAYFEILVEFQKRHGSSREHAENVVRESIGYWSGYYDLETRERVERLFRCEHPVLGPIDHARTLSACDILEIGLALGRRAKDQP